jgi:hypothetical protein
MNPYVVGGGGAVGVGAILGYLTHILHAVVLAPIV